MITWKKYLIVYYVDTQIYHILFFIVELLGCFHYKMLPPKTHLFFAFIFPTIGITKSKETKIMMTLHMGKNGKHTELGLPILALLSTSAK